MDYVYNNFDDCNPIKSRKMFIAFNDMIKYTNTNRSFQSIVREYVVAIHHSADIDYKE